MGTDTLSETLLKMDVSKVSVSELLPNTEAEGELSWSSEEGLAWRMNYLVPEFKLNGLVLVFC